MSATAKRGEGLCARSPRAAPHFDGGREYVTFASDGLDVARLAGIVLQALPQPAHQKIDRTVERFGVATLRQAQQLIAAEYPPGIIEENTQQTIFGTAQCHHRAGGVDKMTVRGVEDPVTEGE